jgi:hypothetical protein
LFRQNKRYTNGKRRLLLEGKSLLQYRTLLLRSIWTLWLNDSDRVQIGFEMLLDEWKCFSFASAGCARNF